MTTKTTPEFLTVSQTAARLGLHHSTVRRKIDEGLIPAVQAGGRGSTVLIPVAELEQWLYAERTP